MRVAIAWWPSSHARSSFFATPGPAFSDSKLTAIGLGNIYENGGLPKFEK
jgi:hypothetical protein